MERIDNGNKSLEKQMLFIWFLLTMKNWPWKVHLNLLLLSSKVKCEGVYQFSSSYFTFLDFFFQKS